MESMYTRISSAERVRIEEMINEGASLVEIAEALGKSPTSISREVKRNRVDLCRVSLSRFLRNPCAKRESCTKKRLCAAKGCNKLCSKCSTAFCHTRCGEFEAWVCKRTGRWPYVCNRCRQLSSCPEQRYSYDGVRANRIAKSRASLARKGLSFDAKGIECIDALVSPLLKKGQSPYHIWNNHRDELGMSLTTFYAYINAGLFEAGRMDLSRAVNFKTRKKRRKACPASLFEGRTYDDYLSMMEAAHECF